MASFQVIKKNFTQGNDANSTILVGYQFFNFGEYPQNAASIFKNHSDIPIEVQFDSNGGAYCPSQTYIIGQPYGSFPIPTNPANPGFVFDGWFTLPDGGQKIQSTDIVDLNIRTLYAHWSDVFGNDFIEYEVSAYDQYLKTGIYSASRIDSTKPIAIDWGDGTDLSMYLSSSISKISHQYQNAGSYFVRIGNISSVGFGSTNTTWANTTSMNSYTFRRLTKIGTLQSFDSYSFCYCSNMDPDINILSSVPLTATSTYMFSYTHVHDISPVLNISSLTALKSSAFRYMDDLSGPVVVPSRITSFAAYTFANNPNLLEISVLGNPTSLGIGFLRYCSSIRQFKIPSSVASLANYTFDSCPNLSSITCEKLTAPTATAYTFGGYRNVATTYCGYNSAGSGTNVLKIPNGATGYTNGYWNSVLLDANKCGFHIEYIT